MNLVLWRHAEAHELCEGEQDLDRMTVLERNPEDLPNVFRSNLKDAAQDLAVSPGL